MSYRHYRGNPLFNPAHTVTDIEENCLLASSYFDSILKARIFLKQIECLPEAQKNSKEMRQKISAACKIVERADRRNQRRRARRSKKAGKAPRQAQPLYTGTSRISSQFSKPSVCERIYSNGNLNGSQNGSQDGCRTAAQRLNERCDNVECKPLNGSASTSTSSGARASWEEVLGPKGEVVRFKLVYDAAGNVIDRKRLNKEKPHSGDIVLDLTRGVEAWQIVDDQRQPIKLTRQMEQAYKNSILYKVRQFAAGQISIDQFSESLKTRLASAKMRKHKKNRKK